MGARGQKGHVQRSWVPHDEGRATDVGVAIGQRSDAHEGGGGVRAGAVLWYRHKYWE